jgi:hypothetical protein
LAFVLYTDLTGRAKRLKPGDYAFKGGEAMELAFFNGQVAATGSFLRAVIATGVILVDANGFFAGVDFTSPALNGNSGVAHCPNA